jgi:CDP-glycerol glycerophosphotransferase (TagB/SpsB family)
MVKLWKLLSSPEQILNILSGFLYCILFSIISSLRILYFRDVTWICFKYDFGIYTDFYINLYSEVKRRENSSIRIAVLSRSIHPLWFKDFRYDTKDYVPDFFLSLLKSKIVVHATFLDGKYLLRSPNLKNVQIFHGFASFGAVLNESYINNVDLFVANTRFQKEQIVQSEILRTIIHPEKVKVLGYPKLDNFVVERISPTKIKTIFYGPTYHKEISSIFDFLEPLISFCKETSTNLIIKLHPLLYAKFDKMKSGGVDWIEEICRLELKYNFSCTVLPRTQIFSEVYRSFLISDLFMTDNSGLGYEFVLTTQKPIVFLGEHLKVPLDDIKNKNYNNYQMYPEVYYRGVIGPIMNHQNFFKQMKSFVDSGYSGYQEEIIAFSRNFTENVGNASAFIVDEIEELIS